MNQRSTSDTPQTNLAHEVFGGAYERESKPARGLIGSFAVLVSRTPEQGEERATRWQKSFAEWRDNRRKRRAEKKEAREFDGSLGHIGFKPETRLATHNTEDHVAQQPKVLAIPQQRQPSQIEMDTASPKLRPHSVHREGEKGLYRSVFARQGVYASSQPQEALSSQPNIDPIDAGTAALLQRAADHARIQLNAAPTIVIPPVQSLSRSVESSPEKPSDDHTQELTSV